MSRTRISRFISGKSSSRVLCVCVAIFVLGGLLGAEVDTLVELTCRKLSIRNADGKVTTELSQSGDAQIGGNLTINGDLNSRSLEKRLEGLAKCDALEKKLEGLMKARNDVARWEEWAPATTWGKLVTVKGMKRISQGSFDFRLAVVPIVAAGELRDQFTTTALAVELPEKVKPSVPSLTSGRYYGLVGDADFLVEGTAHRTGKVLLVGLGEHTFSLQASWETVYEIGGTVKEVTATALSAVTPENAMRHLPFKAHQATFELVGSIPLENGTATTEREATKGESASQ